MLDSDQNVFKKLASGFLLVLYKFLLWFCTLIVACKKFQFLQYCALLCKIVKYCKIVKLSTLLTISRWSKAQAFKVHKIWIFTILCIIVKYCWKLLNHKKPVFQLPSKARFKANLSNITILRQVLILTKLSFFVKNCQIL